MAGIPPIGGAAVAFPADDGAAALFLAGADRPCRPGGLVDGGRDVDCAWPSAACGWRQAVGRPGQNCPVLEKAPSGQIEIDGELAGGYLAQLRRGAFTFRGEARNISAPRRTSFRGTIKLFYRQLTRRL